MLQLDKKRVYHIKKITFFSPNRKKNRKSEIRRKIPRPPYFPRYPINPRVRGMEWGRRICFIIAAMKNIKNQSLFRAAFVGGEWTGFLFNV